MILKEKVNLCKECSKLKGCIKKYPMGDGFEYRAYHYCDNLYYEMRPHMLMGALGPFKVHTDILPDADYFIVVAMPPSEEEIRHNVSLNPH